MRQLLTIAIPVKNGEKYLRETLKQIPDDVKIILSDNYSTDATLKIAEEFQAIQIVTPELNLRMSDNWNYVTSKIETKYFRLCSHDDLLHVESLLQHVELLELHPEVIAAYSTRDLLITLPDREFIISGSKFKGKRYDTSLDLLREICKIGSNPMGETFAITFRTKDFTDGNLVWRGIDLIHELDTYLTASRLGSIVQCEISAGKFRVHLDSYSANIRGYFKQASAHRKWIKNQQEFYSLELRYRMLLTITTRVRALLRTILFSYLRLAKKWK